MSRLFAPVVLAAGLALAAPAALGAPPAHRLVHVVQSGDTLSGIAHRYGCPLEELVQRNHLRSDHIVVGSKLLVPWPDPRLRVASEIHVSVHRVLPGETLLSIADRYDADARSIRLYNSVSGDRIRVGQRLEIPTAGPALTRRTFGYEVQPGDTALDIARRLDVPVRHIRYLNPGVDLRNLEVGQRLTVYRYEPVTDEAATLRAQPVGQTAEELAAAGDPGPVDIDIDDFDDAEQPASPEEQAGDAIEAASQAVARATGAAPKAAAKAPAKKPQAAPKRPVAEVKAPAKGHASPAPEGRAAPKAGACRCACPSQASQDDDDFAYERGE